MDISTFSTVKASEGCTLEIINPVTDSVLIGDDGKPVTFTLLGADSDAYQQAQIRMQDARLQSALRRGRLRKEGLSAKSLSDDAITLLVVCTKSWSTNWEFQGQKLECNEENARLVYKEMPWLREQVSEFIEDRANFLGN